MRTMELTAHWFGLTEVILVWVGEILLESCKITSLDLTIAHRPGGQGVIAWCILLLNNSIMVLMLLLFDSLI